MKQNVDFKHIKNNLDKIHKTTLIIKQKITKLEKENIKNKNNIQIQKEPAGISLYNIYDQSHIYFVNSLRN